MENKNYEALRKYITVFGIMYNKNDTLFSSSILVYEYSKIKNNMATCKRDASFTSTGHIAQETLVYDIATFVWKCSQHEIINLLPSGSHATYSPLFELFARVEIFPNIDKLGGRLLIPKIMKR